MKISSAVVTKIIKEERQKAESRRARLSENKMKMLDGVRDLSDLMNFSRLRESLSLDLKEQFDDLVVGEFQQVTPYGVSEIKNVFHGLHSQLDEAIEAYEDFTGLFEAKKKTTIA